MSATTGPSSSTRYRLGRKPQCGKQIQQVRPAWILDGHPVTGPQMGGEHPLDAVEGARGHREVLARHAVVSQRRMRVFGQSGDTAGSP